MAKEVIVEVKHMDKRFGSTIALNDVNITIRRGEIQGLIGENGSGKSTVTSIISGMQKADKGEMTFKGEKWEPQSMLWALEHGIGMIVQENGTIPGITVAENIFLGETDRFKKYGVVNKKQMFAEAQAALDHIGATHIKAGMMTGRLDMQTGRDCQSYDQKSGSTGSGRDNNCTFPTGQRHYLWNHDENEGRG